MNRKTLFIVLALLLTGVLLAQAQQEVRQQPTGVVRRPGAAGAVTQNEPALYPVITEFRFPADLNPELDEDAIAQIVSVGYPMIGEVVTVDNLPEGLCDEGEMELIPTYTALPLGSMLHFDDGFGEPGVPIVSGVTPIDVIDFLIGDYLVLRNVHPPHRLPPPLELEVDCLDPPEGEGEAEGEGEGEGEG